MHDVLTPSPECGLSKPPPIFPYRPSSKVGKHSFALQRKRCMRAVEDSTAWLRLRRTIARVIVAVAPFVCQIATSTVFESSARCTGHVAFKSH